MTYSVTVAGTKEEVVAAIESNVAPYHPMAASAFIGILSDLKGDKFSFNASGHDNSCSLSVSSWVAGAAQGSA